jgi:hypothetical protein
LIHKIPGDRYGDGKRQRHRPEEASREQGNDPSRVWDLSATTKSTSFQLSPGGGYFFIDNLAAGIDLNLN